MRRICLGLVMSVVALLGHAEEPTLYQIELIIFENLDPSAGGTEVWRDNPGTPDLAHAVALLPEEPASNTSSPAAAAETSAPPAAEAPSPPRDFLPLPSSQLRLTRSKERLQNSSRYRPLIHLGWIQSLTASEQAPPVRIYSGMESGGAAGADLQHPIDGTVTVNRGRYLHVDADLIYFKQHEGAPEAMAYRLVESRRTRSNELQYLDHPLFGLLVNISPYEPKKAGP